MIAFPNETLWAYSRDAATGAQIHTRRSPPPTYTLRCFAICRAVKLFYRHARFLPTAPAADPAALRRQVKAVLGCNSRSRGDRVLRIEIPGFRDLHSLSAVEEAMLKEELGGPWRSYFQRGNWRMVLPFTRHAQAVEAEALCADITEQGMSVIHVFTFPALSINHALVVHAFKSSAERISYQACDPNTPGQALAMIFDRGEQTFRLASTAYFIGGAVKAYRVYSGLLY